MAVQSKWIIVTGPPGSGKSTVSALLATNNAQPTIHLHTDSFYAWIKTGFIAPYLPESAHQNEVVLGAITSAAMAYSHGGYDVIIDGVIGPWIVDAYAKKATVAKVELDYIVLDASLDILLKRAAERDEKYLKDPKPITMLHQAFSKLGQFSDNRIDAGKDTPEEITATLKRRLLDHELQIKTSVEL